MQMSKQNTSWMLTEFIAFNVMKESLTLSIYAVFLGKSIVKSNLMQILKICYIFLLKKNQKKQQQQKKKKKHCYIYLTYHLQVEYFQRA